MKKQKKKKKMVTLKRSHPTEVFQFTICRSGFPHSFSAKAIKWIKGALIGSGAFGSVYLGMDAKNGLLMAVKQVELPTGAGANEERKQSMLTALEREIELLKELQHENIVQYLGKHSLHSLFRQLR